MDMDIERQRAHFNAVADLYERGSQDANHRRIKELIWQEALTPLKPLQGRRIRMLEPMCGYAEGLQLFRDLAGLDCEYDGFDYSDAIVEKLSGTFGEGRIWQADVTKYQPESETYDLMFVSGGLHHVPDYASRVVANLAPGLKAGGYFVSFEPTYGNPLARIVRENIYRRNAFFDEATERSFPVSELEGFFTSAGLEPVRLIYPGLLAYIFFFNTYAFPKLNRGGRRAVDRAFAFDSLFMKNAIGRTLSFATISIWRKPGLPHDRDA